MMGLGLYLQASSGFIQGASPNHALAMSPAGSGHLSYNLLSYSHRAQADHTVSCRFIELNVSISM